MEVWDEGEDDEVGLYGIVWYGIVFFFFPFFFSFLCIRLMGLEGEREARASREPPCILLSSVIYLFLGISIVSTTDDDQHIYSLHYRVTLQALPPFPPEILFPIFPSIHPSIHHTNPIYPIYASSPLVIYTCPINTTHPTTIAIVIMGKFVTAKSRLLTKMCFLAKMSLHSMPAREALKAVLKAP